MHGDFSRLRQNENKNYDRVLQQQGRVLLDSDWNDQARISGAWHDAAAGDTIGRHVAAVPVEAPDSGKILMAAVTSDGTRLKVNGGSIWVDGIRVDMGNTSPVTATYMTPTDVPGIGTRDAVILEVWRETVSGYQENGILEPALGGPDTTVRVLTAKAFRLLRLKLGDNCKSIVDMLDTQHNKGTLFVKLKPTSSTDGDCPTVNAGGYSGPEHNLYRIEMAKVDGDNHPWLKWSQFNGGLVGRGIFDVDSKDAVRIEVNKQAIMSSGLSDFYLETVEYDKSLGRWKITYGANVSLDPDRGLVINKEMYGKRPLSAVNSTSNIVFFRLWNGIRSTADFATLAELQDGICLLFNDAIDLAPGDYWTFPVRAGMANSNVLVGIIDDGKIIGEPPHGIQYHRVPLAIIQWNEKEVTAAKGDISDCRNVFPPLTGITADDVSYREGTCSMKGAKTVQQALDVLCQRREGNCTLTVSPATGWWDAIARFLADKHDARICFQVGAYEYPLETPVTISGKGHIRITGCGSGTQITAAKSESVFHFIDCESVTVKDLYAEGGKPIIEVKPKLVKCPIYAALPRITLKIDNATATPRSSVKLLQCMLAASGVDSSISPSGLLDQATISTIETFTKNPRIGEGDTVGPKTWEALLEHDTDKWKGCGVYDTLPKINSKDIGPAYMKIVQCLLVRCGAKIPIDGTLNSVTSAAIAAFKKSKSIKEEALVGPATWEALVNASPVTPQSSPVEGSAPPKPHLNGTLTFSACADVCVEGAELRCGPAAERTVSCINIRDAADYHRKAASGTATVVGTVRIRDCDIHIGNQQVGILLVNVDKAMVEGNVLSADDVVKELTFEEAMKNKAYRAAVSRMVVESSGIGVTTAPKAEVVKDTTPMTEKAASKDVKKTTTKQKKGLVKSAVVGSKSGAATRDKSTANKDQPAVQPATEVAGGTMVNAVHPLLSQAWSTWLAKGKPKSLATGPALKKYAIVMVDRILARDTKTLDKQQAIGTFTEIYDTLKKEYRGIASQGIVIAGNDTCATDIKVVNNHITGAMQSIHVAVSHRENKKESRDRKAKHGDKEISGFVTIVGNYIEAHLPFMDSERHGIFVGNCDSVLIRDNFVSVHCGSLEIHPSVDGIRVFGYLGRMAIVRQNHIKNATVGIRFAPLGNMTRPQWILTDNLAENSGNNAVLVDVPAKALTAVKGKIRGLADNYA